MSDKERTTVYWEAELKRKFKELCVREDTSMSEKTEDWIRRYVDVHWPGNPQTPITLFVDPQTKLDEEESSWARKERDAAEQVLQRGIIAETQYLYGKHWEANLTPWEQDVLQPSLKARSFNDFFDG